jgi:UDP-N-acetylglucosamine diphosphorylase/glucosamine-1-phosphate N-acetyltransferase
VAAIVLFEDARVTSMNPITLTRAACFVKAGSYHLADLIGHTELPFTLLCRSYLQDISARNLALMARSHPGLFLNASLRPDTQLVDWIRARVTAAEAFIAMDGDRVAAAFVPKSANLPPNPTTESIGNALMGLGLPVISDPVLSVMTWPFHAVQAGRELCLPSLEYRLSRGGYQRFSSKAEVWVGEGVEVADLVTFKTENGPIILENDAQVNDFVFFRGPVYIGKESRVLEHASIKDGVTTGRTCKLGGEVESSHIDDFSNKQHYGYLGHSFVGSWVNLGAGTSNSDLKNTYGTIQLMIGGKRVDTGLQFLGCVIGDYSKSAINTSIYTGKIIGVGSMLYGFVGHNVASFVNFAHTFGQITECPIAQSVKTQARMFSRRGVEQRGEDIRLLEDVFSLTTGDRRLSADPLIL